jgi:hypothetical protein
MGFGLAAPFLGRLAGGAGQGKRYQKEEQYAGAPAILL